MKIQQSAEDYLECILILLQRQSQVRSVDIVKRMGFSKPSVSVAMKNLREGGYIEMDGQNRITLTPAGLEVATRIYERHQVVSGLLVKLGVDHEIAEADACKIEHTLSPESFEALKTLL